MTLPIVGSQRRWSKLKEMGVNLQLDHRHKLKIEYT
jgi:hypothetical protein